MQITVKKFEIEEKSQTKKPIEKKVHIKPLSYATSGD
jgi:hypothetical protein